MEEIVKFGGPLWKNVVVGKSEASDGEVVRTPGMKYKHYSPRALVVLFKGCGDGVRDVGKYLNLNLNNNNNNNNGKKEGASDDNVVALLTTRLFNADKIKAAIPPTSKLTLLVQHLGTSGQSISRNLFSALRDMDEQKGVHVILVEGIDELDEGLAVMNRLTKAASTVING